MDSIKLSRMHLDKQPAQFVEIGVLIHRLQLLVLLLFVVVIYFLLNHYINRRFQQVPFLMTLLLLFVIFVLVNIGIYHI